MLGKREIDFSNWASLFKHEERFSSDLNSVQAICCLPATCLRHRYTWKKNLTSELSRTAAWANLQNTVNINRTLWECGMPLNTLNASFRFLVIQPDLTNWWWRRTSKFREVLSNFYCRTFTIIPIVSIVPCQSCVAYTTFVQNDVLSFTTSDLKY